VNNFQENVDGTTQSSSVKSGGGFITFDDTGEILISPVADVISLKRMGLDPQNPPRPVPLNTDQKHLLAHHRKETFLSAAE
jgi:hypothetical protein